GLRRQKIKEYRERFANPYVAAEEGWIDAVVAPADLRRYLINAFGLLAKKASCRPGRKHGLMPV
ncbi:MAG: methylmalonyl-CoA carboxyltransferase, partial [Clostridia bacterium]|nr:methylmalonyl-CoA carboxyltransferase [Clostridia bacterium]